MILATRAILPEVEPISQWQPATWDDYLAICDNNDPSFDRIRVFFNEGYLFTEMGPEGINHSLFSNIFPMIFVCWFTRQRSKTQIFKCLDRCLLEKPKTRSAVPDLLLYIGENIPFWQEGEPRKINLDDWRVPDLVGEVADTTIATDLDEKKQLYAALKIPEYWVIDVSGKRVLAFRLGEMGKYQECDVSGALEGLPIALLNETLGRLSEGDHGSAALWFRQQISDL
jgi:Uma2 family endonuclease